MSADIDPAYDEHGLRRIDAPLGDEDTCFPGVADYDLLFNRYGRGRNTSAESVALDQEDITTLIAALEALSISKYGGEYARIGPLLRLLKAQHNDGTES